MFKTSKTKPAGGQSHGKMIEHFLKHPDQIIPLFIFLNLAGGVGVAACLYVGYHLSKAMYDLDGDRNHINE